MAYTDVFPFDWISKSAGNKKWISATAVADYGTSQALAVKPGRSTLVTCDLGACRLVNRAGSAGMVGMGVRYPVTAWVGGQVLASGAFTDDTTDLQDADAGDALLYQRAQPTGNGLLLGARAPFNTVSLILSTAGDQTSPVLALTYWNGSAWVDFTSGVLWQESLVTGPGEKLLVFFDPPDWAQGGSGTNVPQTMYNLRLTFTVSGGGTIDPLVSQVFLGQSHCQMEPVGNFVQVDFSDGPSGRFSSLGDALFPLFSVPSFANMVEAKVRWL